MLHCEGVKAMSNSCFDLAPTGALCYSVSRSEQRFNRVLISLPQERCATGGHYRMSPMMSF